jgi:thymidylate kinase
VSEKCQEAVSVAEFSHALPDAAYGVDQKKSDTAFVMQVENTCTLPDFLRGLFRLLDELEVRYCVLHSWDQLPDELHSDLDLAVHPKDKYKLPAVFERLRRKGYTCFQCLNHSVTGHFFVFYWAEGTKVKTAAVDLVFDHRRSGLILSTSEEMLDQRRRHGEFWIPSAEVEFAYLLAKKSWKGRAPAAQSTRLKRLVETLGSAKAEKIAGEIFPGKWGKVAVQACLNESIADDLVHARTKFWKTSWSRRPLKLMRYLGTQFFWGIRRCVQPTGILIAVLGPDGVGKSTVIAGLTETLKQGFWGRSRLFHWRPQTLFQKKDTGINLTPHAKPERGKLLSMAYLSAFFMDYWVGYAVAIRPSLTRSNFVLFDRYFHDVVVDPLRYRYGGPTWFSKVLSRLVPEPDLVILLDAAGPSIFSRKEELPVGEIERQREAYQQLQFRRTRKIVIDTDRGIEPTVQSSSGAVAEFMRQRLGVRMRAWRAATL